MPGVLFTFLSSISFTPGISAQLYYIRNGVVNEYATKYVIPVSNSIGSLSFMWQHSVSAGRDVSRVGLPLELLIISSLFPSFQMQYTINILNQETDVLSTELSVSKVGTVPTHPSPFAVELKCSGIKSAEIEVLINIQLQNGRIPSNTTELVIKRSKTCLKS